MKQKFNEIASKTDITLIQPNPLQLAIRTYFEKEKGVDLVQMESQGDVVTVDLRYKLEEKDINTEIHINREEAKQKVYDIKQDFEEYLFKEFKLTPLSIQGVKYRDDIKSVEFEISFIYKNVGNAKVEYSESKKPSIIDKAAKRLIEEIENITGKKVVFEEGELDEAGWKSTGRGWRTTAPKAESNHSAVSVATAILPLLSDTPSLSEIKDIVVRKGWGDEMFAELVAEELANKGIENIILDEDTLSDLEAEDAGKDLMRKFSLLIQAEKHLMATNLSIQNYKSQIGETRHFDFEYQKEKAENVPTFNFEYWDAMFKIALKNIQDEKDKF